VFASGRAGKINGELMIKEALRNAFNDVFEHLGVEAIYKPTNAASFPIVALVKEPENMYEVGGSQVIGQIAEFSVKTSDVDPKVGDAIFLGSKKYRIHEEPLLDASNFEKRFLHELKRATGAL
jgi:hypothetical protein